MWWARPAAATHTLHSPECAGAQFSPTAIHVCRRFPLTLPCYQLAHFFALVRANRRRQWQIIAVPLFITPRPCTQGFTLQHSHIENSGDDCIGVWSSGIEGMAIRNMTAKNCAVTAGSSLQFGSRCVAMRPASVCVLWHVAPNLPSLQPNRTIACFPRIPQESKGTGGVA